ncbi:MAG: (d)CMP kinase, partial [Burkholderiales bacterium]|nr:(d)CMP kinase [Burkholderiales bacterium]
MMTEKVDVITIDGPVASGKGAVSDGVAKALGFHVLDSGALYRLTALEVLNQKIDHDNAEACAQVARNLKPLFSGGNIFLDGKDVTNAIRAEEVGLLASKVATYPAVREALFALQRNAAVPPGLVADGRDMGTVIFPNALLKIFLTASAESRAERRYKQLKEKGIDSNIHALVADLKARDERDTTRSASPLV